MDRSKILLIKIIKKDKENNMAIFTIIGIASIGGVITGILWKIIDVVKGDKR